MNYHSLSLALISLAIALSTQPTLAQGARFKYPPHLWKQEQAPLPKPQCNDAVSVSPDILGLQTLHTDPQQLQAPFSPQLQTNNTLPAPSFNPNFGQASERIPRLLSAAPAAATTPLTPAAPTAPESRLKALPSKSISSAHQKRATQCQFGTHTKMLNKRQKQTDLAIPPAVYGNSFGYIPGSNLASTNYSDSKRVSARLLHQSK